MNALLPVDAPARAWLNVDDYFLLFEAGKLERFGKTELLDGEIICMNSQFRRHSYAKNELAYRLRTALEAMGSDLYAMTEVTVAMPPHNAPDPDIVLTNEPSGVGPVPLSTVAMLVEVADATLKSDVKRKTPIYARQGVAEFWLVDLVNDRIVQHTRPTPDGFAERTEIPLGQPITAATIPGLTVATDKLG